MIKEGLNMDRRSLLRLFGIGATIIPVVGGIPRIEAPAKLIEVPALEPVQVFQTVKPILPPTGVPTEMLVQIKNGESFWLFKSRSIIRSISPVDVTQSGDSKRSYIPGGFVTWKFEGEELEGAVLARGMEDAFRFQ